MGWERNRLYSCLVFGFQEHFVLGWRLWHGCVGDVGRHNYDETK